MNRVKIGKNFKINISIIYMYVEVPPDTTMGYDLEQDKKHYFVDDESNIIVIAKGFKFPSH